jgi:Na+/phosphate symporter
MIMENNRAEQKEALETLVQFNERLVKNMDIVANELSGHRLDDTDKLLKSVVDATNWEIQVVNGTMELLNEGKQRVDKEAFNGKILHLGEALREKNDGKTAEAIRELIPEFEHLQIAAKEAIAAA